MERALVTKMKKLLLLLLIFLLTGSVCLAKDLVKETNKQLYKTTIGEDNDEVVIGDEKSSSTFKPHIKFTKWNGKKGDPGNYLTIKPSPELEADLSTATTTLSGKKIEHKGQKIGWYVNPDLGNSNDFKFGLILYQKPDDKYLVTIYGKQYYQFQFQLEGWEEYNFFYQPPFKNINPDGSTWEDNGRGGQRYRPAEISGGYCIYHKNKRNYVIGQINYGRGKLGDILVPSFIDELGNKIKGAIHIENGIYSVSCSRGFLDNAVYPVIANDTFGNTNHSTSNDTSGAGGVFGCRFTLGASGTVTGMTIYAKGNVGTINVKSCIYDNDSGYPNNLLATSTDSVSMTTTLQDWNFTINNYAISPGTYHLGAVYSGDMRIYFDEGTDEMNHTEGSFYPNPPNPWAPGGYAAYIVDIYATYTPAGAAAPTQTFLGGGYIKGGKINKQ